MCSLLHSGAVVPAVVNTNGTKVALSVFITLELYLVFFLNRFHTKIKATKPVVVVVVVDVVVAAGGGVIGDPTPHCSLPHSAMANLGSNSL